MLSSQTSAVQTLAERFAAPLPEYSPVPIWWWSGDRLERSRLRWQMEQLIAGGVYNVVIMNLAPTGPLYAADADDPIFMSEDWWAIFLTMCEDVREVGMRVWFYDQIGFSGANLQGEIVRENLLYAGQALASITSEGDGYLQLECPPEGIPLAASWIALESEGNPDGEPVNLPLNGRIAFADAPVNKRLRLMYAVPKGFDYYNPAACARLFDKVHFEFEQRASQYFGDVIVGSFMDELPTLLSWSADFPERFQQIKHYDLLENLTAVYECESIEAERIRADYHEVRALLAEEAFFKPLHAWHERHGLLCGFDQQGPARAGEPIGCVKIYADYLKTHRWFTAPGSDHHGNAKIHSSLAHLYNRPRVWIEAFHSSGWGGTLEETFDWLLPWLLSGATLYDPHAVYYSTHGGWFEWAPPSTCWRQPYWRHYHQFAATVSRLCFLLSQGHHVSDVGILYPTTTVQAGLTIDGPLPSAQTAHDAYLALTGRQMFLEHEAGVLDRAKRDYDVLDDASLQRGTLDGDALRIGEERYQAIILPGCSVLEAGTVDQLIRFVKAGGLLIAVAQLPQHILRGTHDQLEQLLALFDTGKAIFVENADQGAAVLDPLTRAIEAPVPTLHRHIDGADVIFIPAAFPHATESNAAHWLHADYDFDVSRYQRQMRIVTRGFTGQPQLWNPVTGQRQPVDVTQRADGSVEIMIRFDAAPAALLVWPGDVLQSAPLPHRPSQTLLQLPDEWSYEVEQTLDNRYGDFDKPDFEGAPPVQTWHFEHRTALLGGDELDSVKSANDWSLVVATFGPYGWSSGVRPVEDLPKPLRELPEQGGLAGDGWEPAVYSLSRGIHKDDLHAPTLGPKGHVPEEFLTLGAINSGEGVQFRTTIWLPEAKDLTFALAAPVQKSLWINGQAYEERGGGYLWMTPVSLRAGMNLIEWRLVAQEALDLSSLWSSKRKDSLRAYWTLVTDIEKFTRPERIIPVDGPVKDSLLAYATNFDLNFDPTDANIHVVASAPCRVLVNGIEVGRQGGFEPYERKMSRVQLYALSNLQRGPNTIELHVFDPGPGDSVSQTESNDSVAVTLDGLVLGAEGERQVIISGTHWRVSRDDAAPASVKLYRPQWIDPAWTLLWRRPHPLSETSWLDGTPLDDVVLPVIPDAQAGSQTVEWFRWVLPAGAVEMRLPIAGQYRVWIDENELTPNGEVVIIPPGDSTARTVYLRVVPERGRSEGAVFSGPVTYNMGTGRIRLGDWSKQGLASYSGGIRYQTEFSLDSAEDDLTLDLGQVRGTAEVWVNRMQVGVAAWFPYTFNVTEFVRPGNNTVEVLVLNTLAPYFDAVSPTHYIRRGQTVSGMMGPVTIQANTRS